MELFFATVYKSKGYSSANVTYWLSGEVIRTSSSPVTITTGFPDKKIGFFGSLFLVTRICFYSSDIELNMKLWTTLT
jgi:hypothetical protein